MTTPGPTAGKGGITHLAHVADAIDALNRRMARAVRWLILGAVVVCFLAAFLRYAFSFGYVWIQELYVWQHAIVFMLGSAYTLQVGGHVRVDLFYARRSPRGQAWTDIVGTLVFLIPWLLLVLLTAFPYVVRSWAVGESSPEYGGLPAVYPLKTVILLFAVLLLLQGISVIIRRSLFLLGHPGGALETDPQ
ncbi:TRAP transporter small permease subunit [Arhodomonas sp. SL1]|uniref:TRAP transporter small permease subunit n=1 Tax=Arhodomonas sp. SL1 TaxID=3425691 RepID=UPI003F882C54